jgi:hypothetical protein
MEAIRKAGCPKIAAYLQANIQRDDIGWSFTGAEKWDTGPPTPMVFRVLKPVTAFYLGDNSPLIWDAPTGKFAKGTK